MDRPQIWQQRVVRFSAVKGPANTSVEPTYTLKQHDKTALTAVCMGTTTKTGRQARSPARLHRMSETRRGVYGF